MMEKWLSMMDCSEEVDPQEEGDAKHEKHLIAPLTSPASSVFTA